MKKMRSGLSFCLIVLLVFGLLPLNTWAIENNDPFEEAIPEELGEIITTFELIPRPEYDEAVEDQIVVVYKDSSIESETLELEVEAVEKAESLSDRVDVIELNDPEMIDETIAELSRNPDVLSVERNGIVETSALPNDPYVQNGNAWYFEKIGAHETWDQVSNSELIGVAVIDTGLNTNHPDLANRVLEGYDFVNRTNTMVDVSGHGTKVSGCVAAQTNNGIGISGIAGLANVKIVPYRTGGSAAGSRDLLISHIAAAILAAADRDDVRVINMSFGTEKSYDSLRESVDYAAEKGKIMVSSAGNKYGDIYLYPASYDEVISVGATSNSDIRPNYSQRNDQVNLVAPGDLIMTTLYSGDYGYNSGTSFAAALVSGACAFLLGVQNDLTAAEVQDALEQTALDLGSPGRDPDYGFGRIQLREALDYINEFEEIGEKISPKYQTHIQNIGWESVWKTNGALSGTTGQSLRLEGIKIKEDDADVGVRYQTHIQNIGWEREWKADGSVSGTTGQSLRLEGVRIELTGTDRDLWDIYYQVHAQNLGWLDWAKNGEPAGSEGLSFRLEGIKIKVVPKNDPPPGPTEKPFAK